MNFLPLLVLALMMGVLVVLFLGVRSMTKGGEEAARRSNRLMQWRVALQAGAIALLGVLAMCVQKG